MRSVLSSLFCCHDEIPMHVSLLCAFHNTVLTWWINKKDAWFGRYLFCPSSILFGAITWYVRCAIVIWAHFRHHLQCRVSSPQRSRDIHLYNYWIICWCPFFANNVDLARCVVLVFRHQSNTANDALKRGHMRHIQMISTVMILKRRIKSPQQTRRIVS